MKPEDPHPSPALRPSVGEEADAVMAAVDRFVAGPRGDGDREALRRIVVDVVARRPEPGTKANGGDLTADELLMACRNIGHDITCGACASLFYTGYGAYSHDKDCLTSAAPILPRDLIVEWISSHPDEMYRHRGMRVAIHPEKGIVASGPDFETVHAKAKELGVLDEVVFDVVPSNLAPAPEARA